jgi:hypothetical protein
MGHHAADYQAFDLPWRRRSRGAAEAVGIIFSTWFHWRWGARCESDADAGDKESRPRAGGGVADVDHREPGLAEIFQQTAGLLRRFWAAFQRVFAAGEIIILDIDD